MPAQLEHLNYTVSDVRKTAGWMQDIFDWHIRWEGQSKDKGFTIHVGTPDRYVALYGRDDVTTSHENSYATAGGLNHVAVTVDDLAPVEAKVKAHGFRIGEHYDYEPGVRFYFYDQDGIEYEVVSYN